MEAAEQDFWTGFRETWPDMHVVDALIHAGAADEVIHEAMCAVREGKVPDIEPERIHAYPKQQSRWVPSGMGFGGLLTRRVDEPPEDDHPQEW
jgi:hypothetical protein